MFDFDMDFITNATDFNNALATAINNKDLDALCKIHYLTSADLYPVQEWVQTKEERAAQVSLLQAAYNVIDSDGICALPLPAPKKTRRPSCGECGNPMTPYNAGTITPKYRCNSAHCCPTIGSDC